MKKIWQRVLVIALVFVAFLTATPSKADEQVENIFDNIKNINKGLIDYQANIDIQLQAKLAFIPYNPTMSGSYYYKAPEKHKLVLEKAPSYLKKYPNIFGWHLPKIEKFHSRVAETVELDGQQVWHILMTPKQGMGDILSVEMWVNCQDYTVPRQVTNYKNDGRLSVNVQYTTIEGYKVFDRMSAQFSFPKVAVNANATAKYSNYKFNINLPDSFFDKEKK